MKRRKPTLTRLSKMLRLYMDMNDLSIRVTAKQVRISKSALGRILVNEGDLSATNLIKLLAWMMKLEIDRS